jgi:hypothetical protein
MSDWQDRDTRFDTAFTELRQLLVVERTDTNAAVINKELAWLGDPGVADGLQPDSLYARRKKWALCYTAEHYTQGTLSTQLGESMNSGAAAVRA